MKVIARDAYLARIRKVMGNGLVKIITGIRRCGKSFFLFHIFRDYLLSTGVSDDQIVEVHLDEDDFESLRSPRVLSAYIKERLLKDGRTTYVFIDEIQECKPRHGDKLTFYDVLSSLMKKADVYVTGSNSEMLSDDVATNFRDRGTVIRMWPLSFSEYYGMGEKDKADAWEDYLVWGGMPLAVLAPDDGMREDYLRELFERVYFADIVERHSLRGDATLRAVCDVLTSAVGGFTNAKKISDTLKSALKVSASPLTVGNYLEHFRKSFLFEKAVRWDVKGRRYLDGNAKFYCVDTGLRNARLNFRQVERTHLMENAVYCELVRRGHSVDVGVINSVGKCNGKSVRLDYEVDFVVNRGARRVYVQSAFDISGERKEETEKRSLLMTGDFFRKIIVTGGNEHPTIDDDGIVHVGVIPFMLNEEILGLT